MDTIKKMSFENIKKVYVLMNDGYVAAKTTTL
jgi:hypothetical protein